MLLSDEDGWIDSLSVTLPLEAFDSFRLLLLHFLSFDEEIIVDLFKLIIAIEMMMSMRS